MAASLRAAARSLGAENAVDLAPIKAHWPRVVGPQVAAHAWPVAVRQGVLVVATDHHAWASELRSLAAELVKALRAEGLEVRSLTVAVSHAERPDW